MLKTNEGTVDRALRIILGVALLVWFFFDNGTGALHYGKLIGIVPLLTGMVGWCPIYAMLGLSTCPMKQA